MAGQLTGHGELEAAELSGSVAGAEAAHELGLGDEDSAPARPASASGSTARRRRPQRGRPAARHERALRQVLRLPVRDVTAKDIHLSVEEGYDSIELSKRYTTTTMGPCRGACASCPPCD